MKTTIKDKIADEALKKAMEIAGNFNLMEHFGVDPEIFEDTEKDWPIELYGKTSSRRPAEIRTTLHRLNDQIQNYLEQILPDIIAEQMIEEYLNGEIEVPQVTT